MLIHNCLKPHRKKKNNTSKPPPHLKRENTK